MTRRAFHLHRNHVAGLERLRSARNAFTNICTAIRGLHNSHRGGEASPIRCDTSKTGSRIGTSASSFSMVLASMHSCGARMKRSHT